MPLKEWMFTNMTIRNMLADFGFRNDASRSKNFTEYFVYRLGKYQKGDFWLYFPEKPFWEQYKNEAFNKLREIDISAIPTYFNFHLEQFTEKKKFLFFVKHEVKNRLEKLKRPNKRIKLETAQDWVLQEEKKFTAVKEELNRDLILQEIYILLTDKQKDAKPDFQKLINEIKDLILEKKSVLENAEQRVSEAIFALPSAKIELNNPQLQDKVIEFLYHLSNIQNNDKKSTDRLFRTFSQVDITSVLKTHFVSFKPIKYSTVQKNVGEVVQIINWKNPMLGKLNDALVDFFYK